ncbi:acyl carrier protein [Escherichia coli]|nr:acyl carrier protein [Escherichia coli]
MSVQDELSHECNFHYWAESLVANMIYQVNGVLPKDIRRDDKLINDLGMDSVELIDLLMRLEETGVVISESEITANLTVGDIIDRLQISS